MKILHIDTSAREQIVDITPDVAKFAAAFGNGCVHLFCMHTTCGLTINEGADSDVKKDMLAFFQRLAPHNYKWLHREGNSDAHILSSVLGCSLLAPVAAGKLLLGQWQKIYLYEGDGPRARNIAMHFLASQPS